MTNVHTQTFHDYNRILSKMANRYGKAIQIYKTNHYTVYELSNGTYSGNRGRIGCRYNIFVVYNEEYDDIRYKTYNAEGNHNGWTSIEHALFYTDMIKDYEYITPEIKLSVKKKAWEYIKEQEKLRIKSETK